jgi:hypothetical protein
MPASDPIRVPLERLPLGEDELAQHLARVLEQEGLTHEEAGSLLATWREDFFATRGRRIVTVMPQWMYQAVVPLEVFPVPEEMVRVGLVWKELDALEIGTGR